MSPPPPTAAHKRAKHATGGGGRGGRGKDRPPPPPGSAAPRQSPKNNKIPRHHKRAEQSPTNTTNSKRPRLQTTTTTPHPAEIQRDARANLVAKCNKLWNELREHSTSKERRQVVCGELVSMLRNKIESFVQRPDTSRVIQSCFKFGDESTRTIIFGELSSTLPALCKGKYSSFVVVTLLKYGDSTIRAKITSTLAPHVRSLATHANGVRVANFCLNQEGVMKERDATRFFHGLYGNELLLSSSATTSPQPLSSLLTHLTPQQRESSLSHIQKLLVKIADKALLRYPFAQRLAHEYIFAADNARVKEFVGAVADAALAMVGTSEGAKTVARCLLAGDAKERKKICKEWKGQVLDLCSHDFAWCIVSKALDCVDDTVMLNKIVVDELKFDTERLFYLITQPEGHGRKVFLRLLAPPNRLLNYFSPSDLEETGVFAPDPPGLSTSLKDHDIRRNEILHALLPALFDMVHGKAKELLENERGTDVVREIMAARIPDMDETRRAGAVESLVGVAPDFMEHAKGHLLLKHLVQDESGADPTTTTTSFARALAESFTKEQYDMFAKVNRAAFVLCALASNAASREIVKKNLKKSLKTMDTSKAGVQALMKELNRKE